MKTGAVGIKLIKQFESLKLKGYLCPAGKPTIGFGHTGEDVWVGQEISVEQANELLRADLLRFENTVRNLIKRPVNQNQFDALVSFAFNCGPNNLKESTLLKKVNSNPEDVSIADEFLRWNKAHDRSGMLVELDGPTKRRAAEAMLYFGIQSFTRPTV